MRIAQVAPLIESVPPKLYGGTERVVSFLTEALVQMGHEVTLFASGDSETSAVLRAPVRQALRLSGELDAWPRHHQQMFRQLRAVSHEFDVIHFHTDISRFPDLHSISVPYLSTLHGRLDLEASKPSAASHPKHSLISISNAQRKPLAHANWLRTIYHGLPKELLRFNGAGGDYLAFLGRLSPEKGIDRAIEIAERAGRKLKVAAKIDAADVEYVDSIKALLQKPHVEFIGEIDDRAKSSFLGGALGVLFPIDWPEPFGLVMIESLATGTPVIAFNRGSVQEVIDDGLTGFVVDTADEAVAAVHAIPRLSRDTCRRIFEERFSAERMARDYVDAYSSLCAWKPEVRSQW